MIQASTPLERILLFLASMLITFILALLFLYTAPTQLWVLFAAAIPSGILEHRLLRAILIGFFGVLLATIAVFVILYQTSTSTLPAALQAVPSFLAISLLLPAILGALGGGVGAEFWKLSLSREPRVQQTVQSP